jgi:tetratricopeptide (TPR) repeat protein
MPDQESPVSPSGASIRPFAVGFLAALVMLAVALGVWQFLQRSPQPTSPPASASDVAAASLAEDIARETTQLRVKPHSVISTPDKAATSADALRRGDYAAAAALGQQVLAQSTLHAFSFHPFNAFINHLSEGADPKFLTGLDAWISHEPNSALAYLIRGQYYANTAMLARGSDFTRLIPKEHMERFEDFLHRAQSDVQRSLTLNPDIPWSYSLLLQIALSGGDSHEVDEAFRTAVAHFPTYYEPYRLRLFYLQPKWGGSVDAMYQFVDQYAGSAPQFSPLKLLYLQLTADLLSQSQAECWGLKHEQLTECTNAYMNENIREEAKDGVTEALAVYNHVDAIQFSAAIWPILADMAGTPSDSTMVNTILQLAAQTMGSDTQLIHGPGHNNYVLDDITAHVWAKLGNTDNVDQKFNEALQDAERTSFANQENKEQAIAAIYDDMAWYARNNSDYAKAIVYYDAANIVAGLNHGGTEYLKCFAYMKLRHFKESVDECTRLINAHREVANATYNRARSYEAMRSYPAALADYAFIAQEGPDNWMRDAAVINMEHINSLLGKYSEELAIFEKYPFVFDEQLQDPEDLAIAYNNRCFAYMKLGQLNKALDDCNTSLRYGRLPDALQKQQEIQKLLSAKAG